jgi:hypothetical protein
MFSCGTIQADGTTWALQLLGAAKRAGIWELRLRVVGDGAHEVTVKVAADSSHAVTAARVTNAVRNWAVHRREAVPAVLDLVS